MKRIVAITVYAIALTLTLLTLVASTWLSQTLFSAAHYQRLITRPGYLPLVRQAIEHDLQAQASYAGVPDEVLFAGLDNDTIHLQLRQHVVNFAAALNSQAASPAAVTPASSTDTPTNRADPATTSHTLSYPSEQFLTPLRAYLEQHNQALGQQTTPDQLLAIEEVADQAAATVLTHIILVDPAAFQSISLVQQTLSLLHQISQLVLPSAAVLVLLMLLALILTRLDVHQQQERRRSSPSGGPRKVQHRQGCKRDPFCWTRATLISAWLTGSVFLVPALVMQSFDLTSRLAIQTAYLKFALQTLVDRANIILIVLSAVIFFLASTGLITLAHISKQTVK